MAQRITNPGFEWNEAWQFAGPAEYSAEHPRSGVRCATLRAESYLAPYPFGGRYHKGWHFGTVHQDFPVTPAVEERLRFAALSGGTVSGWVYIPQLWGWHRRAETAGLLRVWVEDPPGSEARVLAEVQFPEAESWYLGAIPYTPAHATIRVVFQLRDLSGEGGQWWLDDVTFGEEESGEVTNLLRQGRRREAMMVSSIQIANLGLQRVGITTPIASFEEDTEEARQVNLVFEHARDTTLESFRWPFAQRRQALVDLGDPPPEWNFRYAYPTDCLKAHEIQDGKKTRPEAEAVPFSVEGDATHGRVILCDQGDAVLRYTARVEDPTWWPPSFRDALAWRIAVEIAMANDLDARVVQNVRGGFLSALDTAYREALREGRQVPPPDPEWISVRG